MRQSTEVLYNELDRFAPFRVTRIDRSNLDNLQKQQRRQVEKMKAHIRLERRNSAIEQLITGDDFSEQALRRAIHELIDADREQDEALAELTRDGDTFTHHMEDGTSYAPLQKTCKGQETVNKSQDQASTAKSDAVNGQGTSLSTTDEEDRKDEKYQNEMINLHYEIKKKEEAMFGTNQGSGEGRRYDDVKVYQEFKILKQMLAKKGVQVELNLPAPAPKEKKQEGSEEMDAFLKKKALLELMKLGISDLSIAKHRAGVICPEQDISPQLEEQKPSTGEMDALKQIFQQEMEPEQSTDDISPECLEKTDTEAALREMFKDTDFSEPEPTPQPAVIKKVLLPLPPSKPIKKSFNTPLLCQQMSSSIGQQQTTNLPQTTQTPFKKKIPSFINPFRNPAARPSQQQNQQMQQPVPSQQNGFYQQQLAMPQNSTINGYGQPSFLGQQEQAPQYHHQDMAYQSYQQTGWPADAQYYSNGYNHS